MNGQLPTHTRNFGTLPSSKYSYDANYLPLLPVLTSDHTPQFSHSPENWFKAPLPAPLRPAPPQPAPSRAAQWAIKLVSAAPPRRGAELGSWREITIKISHSAITLPTAAQPPCFKSSSICNNMPDEARGALRDYCYILLPSRIVKIFWLGCPGLCVGDVRCGLSKCRSLFTGHVCLVSSDSGGGDGGPHCLLQINVFMVLQIRSEDHGLWALWTHSCRDTDTQAFVSRHGINWRKGNNITHKTVPNICRPSQCTDIVRI